MDLASDCQERRINHRGIERHGPKNCTLTKRERLGIFFLKARYLFSYVKIKIRNVTLRILIQLKAL